MKLALAWVKNNVLAVVAGVVCLASLIFLIVVHTRGNAFITQMKEREKQASKISQLVNTQVTIPPEDIEKPARIAQITVNRSAITALDQAYRVMNTQYTEVFEIAKQINEGRHGPLLEGLLPDPGQDFSKPFDAKPQYLQAFSEMMQDYSPDALYPRLHAGDPLHPDVLREQLDLVTEAFLNEMVVRRSEGQLTTAEAKALKERRDRKWLDLLRDQGKRCHIYADSNLAGGAFAFRVDSWAYAAPKPSMSEIWESQLNLWIQQDIVEVIGRTNRVDDRNYYVTIAPVKRLLKVEIVPGYVGIDSGGGLGGGGNLSPNVSGDVKLPDDFSMSPTGRRSNTIYDVRHVWVELIIDAQRLPEFFDNLIRVNFMTVLHMEVTDVDEYAALREGFMYGTGDAVRARMLIETIWLRDWTVRYMPDTVRTKLGITPPPAQGT